MSVCRRVQYIKVDSFWSPVVCCVRVGVRRAGCGLHVYFSGKFLRHACMCSKNNELRPRTPYMAYMVQPLRARPRLPVAGGAVRVARESSPLVPVSTRCHRGCRHCYPRPRRSPPRSRSWRGCPPAASASARGRGHPTASHRPYPWACSSSPR